MECETVMILRRLRLSAVLPLLGSLTLLASCGIMKESRPPVDDRNSAQLPSFTIVYAKDDLSHKQGIASVIGAFEKSHPNLEIDDVNETWTGNYSDYLKMKVEVGEFPDLVEMRDTQLFADTGLLHEIPGDLADLLRDVPEVNGRVYNLPLDLPAPQGIIYSKAVFREAGIDAVPKTFGEFMQACDKIKRIGIDPIVVGGKDIGQMGYWINKFLMDEVYIHQPDWNAERNEGKVSWTDPGPLKAMDKLASLWERGYVSPSFLTIADNQTASILVSGQAAMLFSGPWMFNQIMTADPAFEYGFFALPDDKGKINAAVAPAPAGWSISAAAAADPAKLEAISQFLHFFYGEDQYPRYLQAVNGIPATREEVNYPQPKAMLDVLRVMNDPKTGKSVLMDTFSGRNMPPSPFNEWLYRTAQDWLTGKMSMLTAMKEADREWDALLKQ